MTQYAVLIYESGDPDWSELDTEEKRQTMADYGTFGQTMLRPQVLPVGLTHQTHSAHPGKVVREAQQADRRRSPWRVGAMSQRSLAHLAGASSLPAPAAPHELAARRRCGTTSAAPRWRSGVAAP